MSQAEIRTNTDSVVVTVNEQLPYDPKDFAPAKFKYIGVNQQGKSTETLGYTFPEGEAVEVKEPKVKYKLRGNPHFVEVGGKKTDSRVAEDSGIDPEEQGGGTSEAGPGRGASYETMRPPYASVLDAPNPLSAEQQKLTDKKDVEAGRAPIGEASDRAKPSTAAKKSVKDDAEK